MTQVGRPSVADTLRSVADDARARAQFFVAQTSHVMRPDVRSRYIGHINELAACLDELAAVAEQQAVRYEQFDAILRGLHAAGFFPLDELVSDVARAIQEQDAVA